MASCPSAAGSPHVVPAARQGLGVSGPDAMSVSRRGTHGAPPAALRALFGGAIDYAGLFPPAALSMSEAVSRYGVYRESPHAWMLGRFVVGAGRLEEFALAIAAVHARDPVGAPWRVSLVCPSAEDALEACARAPGPPTGEGPPLLVIDIVELKVAAVAEVEAAARVLPARVAVAIELPLDGDLDALIAAVGRAGATVKIRTGGLVPAAIPAADDLARAIAACAIARVPLKATAGLHHPVRAEHPLTYDADAPRAVLHGFLNVLLGCALACAAVRAGVPRDDIRRLVCAILQESDPRAFVWDGSRAAWRDRQLDAAQLERARGALITSFGLCSFAEPVDELRALGWLATDALP